VPARQVVGPWTHLHIGSQGGGVALTESLAWLDRYAGPGRTGTRSAAVPEARGSAARDPVRIWVGGEGAGGWRETRTWPPPVAAPQRWYLGVNGSLSLAAPGSQLPPAARLRYDPVETTPAPGGATLSLQAGSRDNRAVECRPDVLVFSSDPLAEPAEVIGEVAAELSVTRDNPYADLFVRLCDVDPRGRSRNVCDGIVRLTAADPLTGTVRVSLLGAAHRFGRGHRIRLQVAGGAFPRFARNPGNGQVDASAADLVPTRYEIGLDAARPSALILPVAPVTSAAPAAPAVPAARRKAWNASR
jgi:putative CocE/NonD family hydrolase